MVSTSDTAKQIQFSSLKQDAAEAAFKARHSFGSSDAFKQIFDGIDKSNKPVEPPKDVAAEPVKAEGSVKIHRHHHKHHGKPDDKSDKHADCDMKDQSSSNDDVETVKSAKTSNNNSDVKKTKTKCHDDDEDNCTDKLDQAVADTTNTVEPKAATAPEVINTSDTDNCDDIGCFLSATNGENSQSTEAEAPAEIIANVATSNETAAPQTDTNDKLAATPALAPTLPTNPQPLLNNVVGESVTADLKSTTPVIGDFQKAIGPHQKSATEKPVANKTAPASDDQDAGNDLSNALKAKAEPAEGSEVEVPKENAKNEHAFIKAAKEKHADHLELLQGKLSAPETHPAAGDRAISAAQKAPDSPAPTLNGSAGGGSPITTKVAAASGAITGLEGLHTVQGEQVTFAGVVRNTKEAHASLMLPSEQVALHLNRMAKSGMSQYDLHLHPAELGRVDIRLEIAKDGTVQATVTADNQQAFDMLQKDSRSLERALQQAGLQTDSGSLSFNLRGDNQSLAQQQAQHNHGGHRNKWMEKKLPEEIAQSKVLSFDVGASNGRVDIRL